MRMSRLRTSVIGHQVLFHRPFRIDEWLLLTQTSPVASGGSAFGTGHVFNRDGALVASFAQQSMIRVERHLMAQHVMVRTSGAGGARRAVRARRLVDRRHARRQGRRVARAAPDATVNVHSRSRRWHGTYADIDDEARRLIALLRAERASSRATVVAFQLPNWREAIVSFAALAMGGYVLVPIVHIYGRKEVAFILERVRCRRRTSRRPRTATSTTPRSSTRSAPAGLPSARRGRRRRRPAGARRHPPGRVGTRSSSLEPVDRTADAGGRRGRGARLHLGHHQRSEGRDPRPPHDAQRAAAHGGLGHRAAEPDGLARVAHATGMIGAVLGPLERGGDIHLIDRWDPGHALEVMAAYDIGGGTGASIFLPTLLDHPDFTPAHAANMEQVGLGGAPVPVELGRRAEALGIKIIRAYGSTEHPSTTGSQFNDPAEPAAPTDGPAHAGCGAAARRRDGADVPVGAAGRDPARAVRNCASATPNPALERRLRRRRLVPHRRHRHRSTSTAASRSPTASRTSSSAAARTCRPPRSRMRIERRARRRRGRRGGRARCPAGRTRLRRDPHARPASRRSNWPTSSRTWRHAGLARQKWPEELRVVSDFPRTASGKVRKVDLRAALRV